MKRLFVISVLVLVLAVVHGQDKVEWTSDHEITSSSFAGDLPALSEDNMQQYLFSATFEFNFQMLSLQFAFTKNFNKYVTAYYIPSYSWMEEGELTEQLLLMANLDFDLTELYARKFRKKMYDSKNLASSVNFYSDLHYEVNNEFIARQSLVRNEMMHADDPIEYLREEITIVNEEIDELSEFCKKCKPKRK